MSDIAVRIQNAHKFYNKGRANELHVMHDISLELPASGLVAIFGKSGCGKTTLLNAIGGLDKIASGKIELFGHDLSEKGSVDTLRNRYIGYIFQNYHLSLGETVYENVAVALRLCGMSDEQEIAERVTVSLKNVGMDKYVSRTPDTLSGGQQQRVAIARALVKNPAIILADEPTGNLDEANTVLVMDILKEISKTHLVLLVTHEAHLVDFYCDRIIEIVDGRVESDRQNERADGYVRRNKNDIYLGDLPRIDTAIPGATLTYYGEPAAPITLSVVHIGGKLYLKCNDPGVKLLDENSEIRLCEGMFNESPAPAENDANPNGHTIDMSSLAPIDGKQYGRLYHPRNAFFGAWRQYFAKPKKKKGRGLRAALVLLSAVLGFMSATIGAGFKQYAELSKRHNERLFYIPLDPDTDYTGLDLSDGHNGVTHRRIINYDPLYSQDELSLSTAAFMTADAAQLTASAFAESVESMPACRVTAGTAAVQSEYEMVITTALADTFIKSSAVGYIDGYEDMVGLRTAGMWIGGEQRNLRVVGVVESPEEFYYVDAKLLSRMILDYHRGNDTCALSDTKMTVSIGAGEVAYINWVDDQTDPAVSPYRQGDAVTILGKTLTVAEVKTCFYEDADIYGLDSNISFVMSDGDFKSIAYSIDKPVDERSDGFYEVWTYMDGVTYANYLQIRSHEPAVTAAHLRGVLGEDGYLSPDEIRDQALKVARTDALSGIGSTLLFFSLICLCVFFIMRASFMSRVWEVGILRAIGVSRRNLVFRFGMETAVLLLLTTVIGYAVTAIFITSLAEAPLFSTMFYFPPWLAVGLAVLIFAAGIFFGVLPARLLLRKTPSEILAKYDI